MHYHCEIVLPPDVEDIPAAIESVMRPFCEEQKDPADISRHCFWDFFVIGGRFAGSKQLAKYQGEKLDQFYQWLQDEKVTVSGIQCGKQQLNPATQIPKVDAKWNELFPSPSGVAACPIFEHSNDQYGSGVEGTIDGDISRLGDSKLVTCERLIFAHRQYDHETKKYTGPFQAMFMLQQEVWNGTNFEKTAWKGAVGAAYDMCLEWLAGYNDEYKTQNQPTEDHLCVTVDYHN